MVDGGSAQPGHPGRAGTSRGDLLTGTTPSLSRRPTAHGYLWATGIVAVCTVVSWFLVPYIALGNVDALYLLAVVVIAARHGRGPALFASALGVLAFDCFIVPPTFGFVPEDATYTVTFVVMLVVALTVSALAAALREQIEVARERFERTLTLYDLARDLAAAADAQGVAGVVREHLRCVFHSACTVSVATRRNGLQPIDPGTSLVLAASDADAAAAAFSMRIDTGRGCSSHSDASTVHVPLVASGEAVGVLSLAPSPLDRFDLPADRLHLGAFANQTAMALERAQLAEAAQRVKLEVEQERLRNTLLHSVSHDLRTPVAAIQGAASTLLQSDALDSGTRRELLQSICSASDLLARGIHNLLEVTRLEAGSVRLQLEWTPVDEIVGGALATLEETLQQRRVRVDLPSDLPPVPMDALLAQQVLTNLIDNAVRHAGGDDPIDIVGRATPDEVIVDVADRGPGIPTGEEQRVFVKFYRGAGGVRGAGAGLGLAIAKAIVDLHHGRIWVEPRAGGGSAFRVAFPRRSADLAAPPDEADA